VNESNETWRPVVGWEGFYEVSDLGRVRSLPRLDRKGRRVRGQFLKATKHPNGYMRVALYGHHPKGKTRYVHSIVAAAFLGPRPPGEEIKHGPSGKTDNRPSNLSYGPHIENCEERARDGAGHAKLNRAKAAMIRARVAAGESRALVASDYDVTESTIGRIVTGVRWRVA
jgi:hypothetical protein